MKAPDILCVGEITIDEIGKTGRTSDPIVNVLNSIERYYGGRGANFSVYASLFNTKVSLLSPVGKDADSADYKNYLKAKKIDITNLYNGRSNLSKAYIFNDEKGPTIFFYGGGLVVEKEKYLRHARSIIDNIQYKALFCTSSNEEINLFYLSKKTKVLKAYAPAQSLAHHSVENIRECIRNADIVFLNEPESKLIEKIIGRDIKTIAKKYSISLLIRTRGMHGCSVLFDGSYVHLKACKANKTVDANGAGDAFSGAFMANYLKTKDPVYSAKIASATASFAVEKVGCQTSIPKLKQITTRAKNTYNSIGKSDVWKPRASI